MSRPEIWLHKAIETGAGCMAYPAYVPRSAEVPFVFFRRSATERERHLDGNAAVPVATFEIILYEKTYKAAKDRADAMRLGVDNFSGTVQGCVITSTAVSAEQDGEPEFFTGEDVPTYSVEMTLDIRFREEA